MCRLKRDVLFDWGVGSMLGILLWLPLMLHAAESAVHVKAASLRSLWIEPEIFAVAQTVSLNDSRLSVELDARVVDIPVQVGDVVETGQVLVRLECRDAELTLAKFKAQLAHIQARLTFAEQQLQRATALEKQRTLAREAAEERQAQAETLRAERDQQQFEIELAQRRVTKCVLYAPFRAVIRERLVGVGEYVLPGTAVMRVIDLDRVEVAAEVGALDLERLRNTPGPLTFQAGLQRYPVRIRTIVPVMDTITRTRPVRLQFIHDRALPGTAGRLVWRQPSMIPADLVVRRGDQLGIFTVMGASNEEPTGDAVHQARFYPLADAQEGRPAFVDLPPDTQVVTEGRFNLNNGDLVILH